MTYCLGVRVKEGLIALADTRITAGTTISTKKKIFTHSQPQSSLFIMTSGLRSLRDKATLYFQEAIDQGQNYNKMFKAVDAFGLQVKRIMEQEQEVLEKAGYKFNLNSIIGGQLKDDTEHKLFLMYPQGNWVELDQSYSYVIIGNSGQGKAILDRVLHEYTTMKQALKAGFLSFDSTRVSNNDVDFPIDVVLYKKNSFALVEHRYERNDLEKISKQWGEELKTALDHINEDWIDDSFQKLP